MNLEDFKNASESFKRRNKEFFWQPDRVLRGLRSTIAKRSAAPALVGEPARARKGTTRLGAGNGPVLRVTIISLRNRACDSDNEVGGCKELRDTIADWCGLDDADDVIEWEYVQMQTRGRQGTIVKIEIVE